MSARNSIAGKALKPSLADSFSSSTHVEFHSAALTSTTQPKHEALSYTWSSIRNKETIQVGESGKETLATTQNLASALRHLRDEDRPRVLWIDLYISISNICKKGPIKWAECGRFARQQTKWSYSSAPKMTAVHEQWDS
jgi:hypothetical protein